LIAQASVEGRSPASGPDPGSGEALRGLTGRQTCERDHPAQVKTGSLIENDGLYPECSLAAPGYPIERVSGLASCVGRASAPALNCLW